MVIKYSIEQLNQLGASRLNELTRQYVKEPGISRYRPTHRGSKGSKCRIQTIKHSLRPQSAVLRNGANKDNLMYIKGTFKGVCSSNFSVGLLNAHSIRNKAHALCETINDRKLDSLFLSETWLSESDSVAINYITPDGFSFLHVPRTFGRGGSVGLVFKSHIKVKQIECSFVSCDALDCYFKLKSVHCESYLFIDRLLLIKAILSQS